MRDSFKRKRAAILPALDWVFLALITFHRASLAALADYAGAGDNPLNVRLFDEKVGKKALLYIIAQIAQYFNGFLNYDWTKICEKTAKM